MQGVTQVEQHAQVCSLRPATPTKHGRKVYGTEKNPPEVLTVQERAGIGSAWKENVPIHNYAHDEPLSECFPILVRDNTSFLLLFIRIGALPHLTA